MSKKQIINLEVNNKKIQYWIIFCLILVNIVAFIFLLNKLYFRLDLTQGKKYSVSKPTVDLIRKLDSNETMQIQYYFNDKCKENAQMAQIIQYVDDILKEYESIGRGAISYKMKQLNIEKDKGEIADLEQQGIQPFAFSQQEEGESKTSLGYSGLIVKYKNKQEIFSPVVADVGFEYNLDVVIRKIINEGGNGLAMIVGVSDRTLDNDYKNVNNSVRKEFSNFKVINSGEEIPSDISTLFILGGDNISDYDLFMIDQFLMNGGKAFIALSGVRVIINPQYGIFGMPSESKLFNLLDFYGIKINRNMIGDNDSYNAFPQRNGFFTQAMRYPIWPKIQSQNVNHTQPIVQNLSDVPLFWASSIDIDDKLKNGAAKLLWTTKNSWAVTSDFKLDLETYRYPIQKGEKSYDMAYAYTGELRSYFENKEVPPKVTGDGKEEKFTGTVKTSGKTQLVVVGSEMQFWDNLMSEDTQLFMMNSLDWLSMDSSLIKIRDKGKFSRPLDKKIRQERSFYQNLIIAVTTYIIPILFIILAIVIYLFRKAKNDKLKQLYSTKNE